MQWKKILFWPCFCLSILAGCTDLASPVSSCELAGEKGKLVNGQCVSKKNDTPILMPERNSAPVVTISVDKPVDEVGSCLHSNMQSRFKLPSEFYKVIVYANGSQTLALVNPFTKLEGLQIDVVKAGPNHSIVNLYDNGMVISKAWQQFPNLCL
ncbi:MAG: hypothetical protein J6568_06415 [Snodgrassella sp.]|nr:hypothetical protein [Snodgrassella sp.]